LRRACLYSIFKFHIGDEFWQQVLSVERSPHFLRTLNELELHGEGGLVFSTQCRAAMYIHSFHKHKLAATLLQNGVSILSDINALQTQLADA
jgi:hypothetical protein